MNMQRRNLRLFAILLVVWLGAYSAPGGAHEVIWDLLLTDDTVYAAGYTDEAFNAVTLGMSEQEVVHRLGPPLDLPYFPERANDAWDKGMRWTKSAHDSHYKCRVVLFRNGRVSEKHAEFYVD
jgi:hypothetical protein